MYINSLLGLLRQVPLGQRIQLFSLMLISGLTEGVGILLLVPLMHLLQSGGQSKNMVVLALISGIARIGISVTPAGILGLFLAILAARNMTLYFRDHLSAHVQHQLVDQLRDRCFRALLGAEWRWLAAGRSSDHANLLLTDVTRVGIGLNFGLGLLVSAVTILAYLSAAVALSWSMTLLALLSGAVVIAVLGGQRKQAMGLGESLGKANRAMQANVQESLQGIKLTKILGNEYRHLQLFRQTLGRLRQQQLDFMLSTSWARTLYQTVGAALLVAYLYLGLTSFQMPMAELLILVLIFGRLIPMLSMAQQQHHHWLHALPALRETDRLLAACLGAKEPEITIEPEVWPIEQGIELDEVCIRYADRSESALNKVSVSFPACTTTAIMGASGAGKSTLADALMGLLQPDAGEIRVDGKPLTGAARRQWRHSVSYVPQETFLFHDTIRSNLLWACDDADDNTLQEALRRAAAEFVFALPLGLDTVVGDGGIRLSGGERQRLALARALLKKPSLLILDEATSALDVENELRVRQAIENLHGDLTVVIIGHRLPTLEHADQVLVMDNGQIVKQGTWTEVRSTQGTAS